METRVLSHSLASSSSSSRQSLQLQRRSLVQAAPRLTRRCQRLAVPMLLNSLAMPAPTPVPRAAVGPAAAAPVDESTLVTTVHSPEELQSVLASNEGRLVVLMCKAKGCRPCKLFARKYKTAAALYRDALFLEIFGDESKDTRKLMIEMGIKVTPTFVIYRGGERVHSHGGVNEGNLHKAVQGLLKESEAGYGHVFVADGDETDED